MLWWLPAAVEAGSSLLKYATRRKSPSFNNTSYGQELLKTKKQGSYSPTAQNEIIGRTSAAAGNVAQGQKADIQGYLQARGMGNSIAGVSALAKPDTDRMRTVSNVASDVTTRNEMSKNEAALAYGRARMGYDEGVRAEDNQATGDLSQGLIKSVGSGIQGFADSRFTMPEDFGSWTPAKQFEWAIKNGFDPNALRNYFSNGDEDIWAKIRANRGVQ